MKFSLFIYSYKHYCLHDILICITIEPFYNCIDLLGSVVQLHLTIPSPLPIEISLTACLTLKDLSNLNFKSIALFLTKSKLFLAKRTFKTSASQANSKSDLSWSMSITRHIFTRLLLNFLLNCKIDIWLSFKFFCPFLFQTLIIINK